MEFTIDSDLIRRILREEARQTADEVAAHGPVYAFARSQLRHDARLSAASDASTLACVEGCAFCCHFRVDVRGAEVLTILDYVRANFSAGQREQLELDVRSRAQLIATLTEDEHHKSNIACPFLQDARCSIYSVRPQTCRNFHATDMAGCKQTFDQPADVEIDPDYAPGVYQAGGAHVDAVSVALKQSGFSVTVYEMNTALAAAMMDPEGARERFAGGADPLPEVNGFEPPTEFIDLVE